MASEGGLRFRIGLKEALLLASSVSSSKDVPRIELVRKIDARRLGKDKAGH